MLNESNVPSATEIISIASVLDGCIMTRIATLSQGGDRAAMISIANKIVDDFNNPNYAIIKFLKNTGNKYGFRTEEIGCSDVQSQYLAW